MKELIEAFQIFAKYIGDEKYPTHCEHDVMYIACDPKIVTEEDRIELDRLGFRFGNGEPDEVFYSFKYGSC